MKIILTYLIIFFSAQNAHGLKRELKIALYDIPPHVMINSGKENPTGVAVDFLEKILLKESGFKPHWLVSPFSRFLIDLESQKADLGLLIAKTPEREKLMRYADTPVFTTDAGVIVEKEFVFTNIKSLSGLILGHTQGSVIPDYFKDTPVKFDTLSGEDVIKRNLQRLRLKRIHGVFIPTYSNGEYMLKKLKMEDQFKIEKIPNTSLDLYFVFRKDIDEKTFTSLNNLISKNKAAYLSLLQKYLQPAKKSPAPNKL